MTSLYHHLATAGTAPVPAPKERPVVLEAEIRRGRWLVVLEEVVRRTETRDPWKRSWGCRGGALGMSTGIGKNQEGNLLGKSGDLWISRVIYGYLRC